MPQNLTPTGTRRPDFRLLEDRLVWARETAPLTQQQLADKLGISKRTVQNYESGVGHPKEARLVLWANACDADYDFLAGDFYRDPTERSVPAQRVNGSVRTDDPTEVTGGCSVWSDGISAGQAGVYALAVR